MEKDLLRNILIWKRKYRNVYSITISGKTYVYKSLSKGEFAAILSLIDKDKAVDIEEAVLSECLLYPEFKSGMFDFDLAGGPETLYNCIVNTIGFSVTDKFLDDVEKERTKLSSLENQITILVCKAFPHLTLSDIDNLTYDEFLRYLTISEAILDVKINIEKPSPTKPGSIDFDQENKVMEKPVPFDRQKRSPRGDVSK